jgi:cell division protease FtsH
MPESKVPPPSQNPPSRGPQQGPKPWRTEGLPQGQPGSSRTRWVRILIAVLAYSVFFGLLTMQDRLSDPETIAYTEFKDQVATQNVAEVFARGDSIQGKLHKAVPGKGEPAKTYQHFTTERPTFANDDLLGELTKGGALVRATPLVVQRGIFTNLLISIAPFGLLIAFYIWMFRRQQRAMGGGLFGGTPRKPIDPESVRVTFADVAGIDEVEAEINEIVDFLKAPEKYRRLGARRPKASCSPARPARARRCSPARRQERRRCRSSAPARRSSSR